MPLGMHRTPKGAEAAEFHLLLDHLTNVEVKAGCQYAVEWQTSGKAYRGRVSPRSVSTTGTVDFQEKFSVTVQTKGFRHRHSWLELKVLQVSAQGREKTYDKLVLNLVQCSQQSAASNGRIVGKRCAAMVTVACRRSGEPLPELNLSDMSRQAALEQHYEDARSQLQDMHDQEDILAEELLAKEQEVELLRQKVEELQSIDQELQEANREVALLQEHLDVASSPCLDTVEQEERIVVLQQRVSDIQCRKAEELSQLDQQYEAEVRQLENQRQFLLLSEEEQDQQLIDLRNQVDRMKGTAGDGRECTCAIL